MEFAKHVHSFKVGDKVKNMIDKKAWSHSTVHAIIPNARDNDTIHVKVHSITDRKGKTQPASHDSFLNSTQVYRDTPAKNEEVIDEYSDKLIEAATEFLSQDTSTKK
jgi:hypothetical protein